MFGLKGVAIAISLLFHIFPILNWQIYKTPPLTQAALETKLDLTALNLKIKSLSIYNVSFTPFSPIAI